MKFGYHLDLTYAALQAMKHFDPQHSYFPELSQGLIFSKQAMDLALLGNAYTDLFQPSETLLLVDNSFCKVAKRVVECCHFGQVLDREQAEVTDGGGPRPVSQQRNDASRGTGVG